MTPADLTVAVLRFALDSILASLTVDPSRDVEELKAERQAATAMLATLKPMDAIQAAFAARAVTAHHAAMECFRRAALPNVPDALVTRLFASGMSLSRLSTQMIKTLEQRKASARPGASTNSIDTIMAASAAATAAREAPARVEQGAAARNTAGRQEPMSSEKRPGVGTPPAARETADQPASAGNGPVDPAAGRTMRTA